MGPTGQRGERALCAGQAGCGARGGGNRRGVAGPRGGCAGRGKGKRGWAAGKSPGRLAWAAGLVERKRWAAEEFGLGLSSGGFFSFSSSKSFPFLFLIQTSLFEFKQNLNSTPTLKQINQCSSMNVTTQLNLRNILIT